MSLSVCGLHETRAGRTILHPTDLTIARAERVGLVGASGSGKSTFGHALVDALRAQGRPVAHVPQSPEEALDPLRSLAFHWREAETCLGLAQDPARQRRLLTALGIEKADLRQRPWGWSRGMQQRFVIAMALIGAPELLVLDEPTSALDPVMAAQTMALLEQSLRDAAIAMLLITHDLGLAANRVERLLVMAEGRIVEDAATHRLLSAPRSKAGQALAAHRHWLALPC